MTAESPDRTNTTTWMNTALIAIGVAAILADLNELAEVFAIIGGMAIFAWVTLTFLNQFGTKLSSIIENYKDGIPLDDAVFIFAITMVITTVGWAVWKYITVVGI